MRLKPTQTFPSYLKMSLISIPNQHTDAPNARSVRVVQRHTVCYTPSIWMLISDEAYLDEGAWNVFRFWKVSHDPSVFL